MLIPQNFTVFIFCFFLIKAPCPTQPAETQSSGTCARGYPTGRGRKETLSLISFGTRNDDYVGYTRAQRDQQRTAGNRIRKNDQQMLQKQTGRAESLEHTKQSQKLNFAQRPFAKQTCANSYATVL